MTLSPRAAGLHSRSAKSTWAGKVLKRADPPSVKKQAILSAAAALFRERGYERTRLEDIARSLNVTKPTLYYYVKNKEDILVEIQQTGFEEIMEELIDLGKSEQSGAEILRRVIIRYVSWVTGEFGVCVTRQFLITLTPGNLARLRKARRTVERKIRETIARGIADRSLRPCEPWIAAAAIFGAFNWMAFWYEAGPNRRSAAELGNAYVDLFIEGIGAGVGRAGASPIRAAGAGSPIAARHAAEQRPAAKKSATVKMRTASPRRAGPPARAGKTGVAT